MNDTDAPDGSYTGVPGPTSRTGIDAAADELPVAAERHREQRAQREGPVGASVLLPARFPRL